MRQKGNKSNNLLRMLLRSEIYAKGKKKNSLFVPQMHKAQEIAEVRRQQKTRRLQPSKGKTRLIKQKKRTHTLNPTVNRVNIMESWEMSPKLLDIQLASSEAGQLIQQVPRFACSVVPGFFGLANNSGVTKFEFSCWGGKPNCTGN